MKLLARLPVLLLAASGAALAAGAGRRAKGREHPVIGVIDLLKKLKKQVLDESQTEEVTYAKFAKWCQDSERSLGKAIEEAKDSIEVLESEIEAKSEENATLTKQIAFLEEELLEYDVADQNATKQRGEANELYKTADGDLKSSIDAFDQVIKALEDAKTSTSASLLQAEVRSALTGLSAVALGSLSDAQLARLSAAAGRDEPAGDTELPDFLAKGDYGSHVKKYEFKSDSVVGLMKELKLNFEDQRVEGTKRETAALNAHNLAKQARDAAVEAAKQAKGEKTTALGDVQSALSTAESTLSDTQGDLKADKKNMAETKKDCLVKKSEWDERSSIRQKEMESMDAGIKILAKVTGVRTEAPKNPTLPPAPEEAGQEGGGADASSSRFLFLQKTGDPKAKAMNLLRQEATRLRSKSFARFADELAAKVSAKGPFDEVDSMIQKMIFRLMAEQTDEDEHKNWCDLEVSKTNASKVDKEEKIKELGLKLKEDKAAVALIVEDIGAADDAVTELVKFMEESTEVRNAGKKENKAAIEDAKVAQDALAQAIAVITAHYKESGMVEKEAWEFVQAPAELGDKPATWDSSYTGVADPKKQPEGILVVLEKISSDFSEMEADTKAQEVTDQKNYDEEMKSAEIEKSRRSKESEMKAQEKQRLLEKVTSLEKSTKHTKEELGAVEQYQKDLAGACLEGDSTYEDKKQARSDEINALKEAQVILQEAFSEKKDEGSDAQSGLLQTKQDASGAPPRRLRAVRRH